MKNKITLDDLIRDLEQAKQVAFANNQANSVVSAIALQAKLLGLDKGLKQDSEPKPVQVIVNVQDARKRND